MKKKSIKLRFLFSFLLTLFVTGCGEEQTQMMAQNQDAGPTSDVINDVDVTDNGDAPPLDDDTVTHEKHSWGRYHWARKSNPFILKLGDNVSLEWDGHLATASLDWSQSSVLDTHVVTGGAGSPDLCTATNGRVEICNFEYGFNGWVGIASIWTNTASHITKGTVKMNDSYFNTATYNTTGWRSLVMCQEIGHTLGLKHQDENFDNAPILPHTCMDYFVPDANEVVHPNQHDYDQLASIYKHLDKTITIGLTAPSSSSNGAGVSDWGLPIQVDGRGRPSLYVRDIGNGKKIFTFVFWAD